MIFMIKFFPNNFKQEKSKYYYSITSLLKVGNFIPYKRRKSNTYL